MGSTMIVRTEPQVSPAEDGARPCREEVRAQLSQLLASPLFNHSKHYPSLLRYVVNETLEGRVGQLKERALGVEVFGRDPNYDTNADPVVRTSACEVRKRIALYYHEPGHEDQIRIDLPSGSYIPEFRFAAGGPRPQELAELAEPPAKASLVDLVRQRVQRKWVVAAAVVFAAVFLGIGTAELRGTPTAVESFWNPVWGSGDSIMLALGGALDATAPNTVPAGDAAGPTFRDIMRSDRLAFSDALTMARLTGLTREFGKRKLDIRRATAFSLTDLRKGPVILVGAFNNSWTMRLNSELRFHYEWNAQTRTGAIRDRQNPSSGWIHDPSVPYSTLTQDYAVVSRFLDPLTEKMVVVVGGMGRDGTIAAGEFVTEPRYLEMLASRVPKHWDKKNLQVLLATDIVNGNTGPPRILAVHVW
jgi:hypothetical protein